jgi:hypothetical protein
MTSTGQVIMVSRRLTSSAAAVTIAVGLCVWVPVASGGSLPSDDQARYAPIQNISYEFGSKFVSGFFMQQAASCVVYLMITEKIDPDEPLRITATRVRVALNPGQIAGLDSEEGRSLNLKCGEGAETLEVNVGDRERLVALQESSLQKATAQSP